MKIRFLYLLVFLLMPRVLFGQSTTVSGQVTDASPQNWNNGTITAVFVVNPAYPAQPQYIWTGGTLNSQISGTLNAIGAYSLSIPSNSAITPVNSQWRFQVCSQASSPCFYTPPVTITGATQTLNITPPGILINLLVATPPVAAYGDFELTGAKFGSRYYNVTSQTERVCQVVSGNNCLTWVDVGAGSASAAGSPPQTQVNDPGNPGHFGGTPCENFPSLTIGPINADCDWHGKGPNPSTDVTRYGVRSIFPTAIPASTGITATINSGSTSVTVSTSSCPSQVNSTCFINGDGVVIYGAGTAHSLTTPSAPTITPSVALAGTGTGFTTPGPTGATNYCARIVARTKQGGLTAAGPETCIATSQATLGVPTPVSITSMTRLNDVVSVTTSTTHGFTVGCSVTTCGEVYITGSADSAALNFNSFNGWWAVATAPDSTHFTFTSAQDTRSGAILSATGGTAQWFNCNHVTWTQVTGAWEYYIYTGATGAETLRGVSRPQGSITIDLTWDDFGSPMMDNFSLPAFVPSAFPVAATSNHLVTTIVSGAGTTTLTLASSASTSVAGATIRLDNAPNILTAATAVANRSTGGVQGGAIFFPLDASSGNNFYVINSYLDFSSTGLPNTVPIVQAGQIWLNETWELGIAQKWSGNHVYTRGTSPSFSPQANPLTTVNTAIPGLYLNNNNLAAVSFNAFSMNSQATNGALLIFAEGQFNFGFDHLNLTTGTTTADYMGIAIYIRGAPGQTGAFGKFSNLLSTSGSSSPTQDGFTHTPNIFCNDCGATRMDSIFMAHRNIFFKGDSANGSNLTINLGYTQGSVEPFLTTTQMFNAIVKMCNVTLDSTIHPSFVSLSSGGTANAQGEFALCDQPGSITNGNSANRPVITGLRIPTYGLTGLTAGGFATNPSRSSSAITSGSANDGNLGNDPIYMENTNEAAIATGPLYPLFVSNATGPAPTCSVSAGGAVTLATYKFFLMPVWQNGSEGTGTYTSSGCTTTNGNQTITVNWSTLPGNPKSYDLYASSGGGFGQAIVGVVGTSVVLSTGTPGNGGITAPSLPAGGPTMLMQGVQGVAAPQMILTGNALVGVGSGAVVSTSYQNGAYDNGNRANGSIGANWTIFGTNGINISSNQFVGTAVQNIEGYTAIPGLSFSNSNQFSSITVTVLGEVGVLIQGNAANGGSGYTCDETTTTLRIVKWSNISTVLTATLSSVGVTGTVGDRIIFSNSGATLTCSQVTTSGVVTTTTATDSSFTGGFPGIYLTNASSQGDNWSGGNLHPIAQLDTEQDWTQPQHFIQPVTIGATNPIAGTLALGVYSPRYTISGGSAPTCAVTGAGTGATCTLSSFSTDNSGAMQINSGTTPGSNGTWTLTFSAGFPNAAFCTVGPGSGGTTLNARATVFDNTNGTLGVHAGVWDNNGVAINASQSITFIISYVCGGH